MPPRVSSTKYHVSDYNIDYFQWNASQAQRVNSQATASRIKCSSWIHWTSPTTSAAIKYRLIHPLTTSNASRSIVIRKGPSQTDVLGEFLDSKPRSIEKHRVQSAARGKDTGRKEEEGRAGNRHQRIITACCITCRWPRLDYSCSSSRDLVSESRLEPLQSIPSERSWRRSATVDRGAMHFLAPYSSALFLEQYYNDTGCHACPGDLHVRTGTLRGAAILYATPTAGPSSLFLEVISSIRVLRVYRISILWSPEITVG